MLKMKMNNCNKLLPFCWVLLFASPLFAQQNVFDGNNDVGPVLHKGSTEYNAAMQEYTMSGAGANIWFKKDEFQYAWKKLKGDFILQAQGDLVGKGVDAHRKFGWMVRNSFDTGSVMACVAIHGDGLTSLQYRKEINANIEQATSSITGAEVFQLERKGNKFIMSVAKFGEPFTVTEVSDINLPEEVYAGLFICSHNKDVVEKVVLRNVRIIKPAKDNFVPYRDYIGSSIEVMDVPDGRRNVLYTDEKKSLQAPNWSLDGKYLIYNSEGLIYKFDLTTKKPTVLNTDFVTRNNNDHVISFDGKMLGLSSSSGDAKYGSLVYIVPIGGGKPIQVTPVGPSYLHGWSPDGKYLIYTGGRNNEYDIYRIPAKGGEEVNLTKSTGLDDGSEYGPDGKYIYFNSTRTGLMQLWRMDADGGNPVQLTSDEYNNWFPHVSPDGKWIVFISYYTPIKADDHPFYKHVYLRRMPVGGGKPTVIAYLYGGQATINTPSWSPDGKKIAFVSNSDVLK